MVRVTEAISSLDPAVRDEIVFVALSTEADLPPEDLQAYAEREGFPFIYAVMPAEYQRDLADDLGRESLIPPLMPHVTIAGNGEQGELHTGSLEPDKIATLLTDLAATAGS